jgi:hypothetical protein
MTSMKSFSPLLGSEGPRREFKITWGLRAGYGSAGRIYDLEEAIRAAHRWMRERDARGEPFLSGMFARGEVVYAGSDADASHDREPVAIFTGEVLPLKYPIKMAHWQSHREQILVQYLAARVRSRHDDELLRPIKPHGIVAQGPEVAEIAAPSATEIKDRIRRLALYSGEESRIILADIVVSCSLPEIARKPIIKRNCRFIRSSGLSLNLPSGRLWCRIWRSSARSQARAPITTVYRFSST